MYEQYARQALNASDEVVGWITTVLQSSLKKWPNLPQGEIEHILDYLVSESAPKRLRRMSYAQAKAGAAAWVKTMEKKGAHINEQDTDVETIHDFGDGSRIVKLIGKNAFLREGFLMSHCVASYANKNVTVYSYRDRDNMPHATFEVSTSDGSVLQVKGKGNGSVHPRYINPIIAFLTSIKVPVRSAEMRNLGYLQLPKETETALKILGVELPKMRILGDEYSFIGE